MDRLGREASSETINGVSHSESREGEESEYVDSVEREDVAERNAEGPHREHRNDQGELDVACRAECRRKCERRRPDYSSADRVVDYQLICDVRALGRKLIEADDGLGDEEVH